MIDADVTTWPGSNAIWQESWGYYGDYVAQNVLNQMIEEGLKRLMNTSSLQAAWQVIIPHFQPEQKIAIRVNQNNVIRSGGNIDALIHPVNNLVKGLVQEFDFRRFKFGLHIVFHFPRLISALSLFW